MWRVSTYTHGSKHDLKKKKPFHELSEWMRDSRKVVPTFESMDQILWCDHSIETFLAVLSYGTIYLYIYVVLTFESVDENLWCYHSNETSSSVLSHGA